MGQYVFKMPDIGEGIVEAEVVKWHVNVSDHVDEEQPIADVMTDKATVEITAPVSGKITFLGCEEGNNLQIGADFVIFEYEGDNVGEREVSVESSNEQDDAIQESIEPTADFEVNENESIQQEKLERSYDQSAVIPRPLGEKPLASPAVRKRARDAGVNLAYVSGSGPANRITQADLEAYLSEASVGFATNSSASAISVKREDKEIKVTGLRKVIASRMQLAKQNIPHFSYVEEVDMTELESLRQHLNKNKTSDQPKLMLLPFIILAMVNAIKAKFPQMNAHFDDEQNVITQLGDINVGMATQTSTGLMVPVIKRADQLELWSLAAEIVSLAHKARENTLTVQQLTGSGITVTSLGRLGGISATPIINKPEVAIIGPNKIQEKLVLDDGLVIKRKVMNISSSFDHRVLDGVEAAEFVQSIREQLENPAALFIH